VQANALARMSACIYIFSLWGLSTPRCLCYPVCEGVFLKAFFFKEKNEKEYEGKKEKKEKGKNYPKACKNNVPIDTEPQKGNLCDFSSPVSSD
jgi:hypothetical protein